jgi:hypothetical protein
VLVVDAASADATVKTAETFTARLLDGDMNAAICGCWWRRDADDPVCWIYMNKKLESREGAGLGSAYLASIRQSRMSSKTCVPFASCHTRMAVQHPQGLHHLRWLRLGWAITTHSEWIRIRKANWFVVAVCV